MDFDSLVDDNDPQSAVAAQGFKQLGEKAIASEPVQNIISGKPLYEYQDMLTHAIAGDPAARMQLAQHSNSVAMGTIAPEAKAQEIARKVSSQVGEANAPEWATQTPKPDYGTVTTPERGNGYWQSEGEQAAEEARRKAIGTVKQEQGPQPKPDYGKIIQKPYADGGEVDDFDPQSAVAAQGLRQGVRSLSNALQQQYQEGGQKIHEALQGDPTTAEGRTALEDLGQSAAMSTVGKTEAPKGTFKGKFDVDAYHGTRANIEAFDPNALGASTNAQSAKKAFFFAEDPSTAADYANVSPSANSLRNMVEKGKLTKAAESYRQELENKYGPVDLNFGKGAPTGSHFSASPEELTKLEELNKAASSVGAADDELTYTERFSLGEHLKDLKRNFPEARTQYRDQIQRSLEHLQDERDGKLSPFHTNADGTPVLDVVTHQPLKRMTKPKAYLESKIEEYKSKLADANDALTPEYEQSRQQEIKDAQDKLDRHNQAIVQNTSGENVLPVKLRMENPYIHDFKDTGHRDESYANIIDKAKAKGHDSVIFKNTYDPANRSNLVKQNIYAVFEPHQIRSKFAKFDPKQAKSGNLSYAEGGEVSDTPQDFDSMQGDSQASGADMSGQNFDSLQDDQEKYGTNEQQFKAGLEGAAQGLVGPLAPAFETHALGVKEEDIRGRAEANPITHYGSEVAGLVAPALVTGGASTAARFTQAGLLKAVGEGVAGKIAGETLASKIGATAARGAIESALITGSDEASKMVLNDPDASAQTALTSVGLSALIGGGAGALLGVVSPLWEASHGSKAGQVAADFKARIAQHMENPDPVAAMTKELQDHHASITSMADEVYGPTGLKQQDIAKAMPEMSQGIMDQAQETSQTLDKTIDKMAANQYAYPPRLTQKLMADKEAFDAAVSVEGVTPAAIFDAQQTLKQQLQSYSKFDSYVKPTDEAYDFVKLSKTLGHDIRTGLEDTGIWGEAAKRQQQINKAFSEYLPTLKDFQSKFTTTVAGEKQIDPGKVATYLNSVGKPRAEIKQEMLQNFLDASDKYKSQIQKIHANLGIENPIAPTALNVTNDSLSKKTLGSKMADQFIKHVLTQAGGESAGAAIGAGAGALLGHPTLGALVGGRALGPFFSSVLPGITKSVLGAEASGAGLRAASDYGAAVYQGNKILNDAAKGIFRRGMQAIPYPDSKDLAHLERKVASVQTNPSPMLKENNLQKYLPGHSQSVTMSAANAVNYLNSIRPSTDKTSPFDSAPVLSSTAKAAYKEALVIAQSPTTVLQDIKDGTLTSNKLQHLQNMYPSLFKQMQQKVTNAMIDHTHDEEPIPYKTRIGLSMFMAQPLDSTMAPSSIVAAQPVPESAPPQQPQQTAKGRPSAPALQKIPKSFQTDTQARSARRQADK